MNNSNSFFEGILLLHVSTYSVIIDKHVLMLLCYLLVALQDLELVLLWVL